MILSDKDHPRAIEVVRDAISAKPSLRMLYGETYDKFRAVLTRCPAQGIALELGSGAGFAKEALPELTTSDVVSAPGIDRVVDATAMPFASGELRAILMLNVFHHIPDVSAFLREADRCLAPGGRIFMVDQHVGPLSGPIFKHLHDEPFDPRAGDWPFPSEGRLSGANGALAWMVFERDRARFERTFPRLSIERYAPHTPLRYWWIGGLRRWTLLPGWAFPLATAIDRSIAKIAPDLSSFVDIELVRR